MSVNIISKVSDAAKLIENDSAKIKDGPKEEFFFVTEMLKLKKVYKSWQIANALSKDSTLVSEANKQKKEMLLYV